MMAGQTKPEELVDEIIGYGVVVIVAGVMVFVTFKALTQLIGQLPAKISAILLTLLGLYVVAVNRKVRNEILSWAGVD